MPAHGRKGAQQILRNAPLKKSLLVHPGDVSRAQQINVRANKLELKVFAWRSTAWMPRRPKSKKRPNRGAFAGPVGRLRRPVAPARRSTSTPVRTQNIPEKFPRMLGAIDFSPENLPPALHSGADLYCVRNAINLRAALPGLARRCARLQYKLYKLTTLFLPSFAPKKARSLTYLLRQPMED
jgi:hypothetical protein